MTWVGCGKAGILDSRLRRPLHNLFQGMRLETGARKMNGAITGRASPNNHSA